MNAHEGAMASHHVDSPSHSMSEHILKKGAQASGVLF